MHTGSCCVATLALSAMLFGGGPAFAQSTDAAKAYPYRPVRVLLAAIQQRIADLGAEVIGNTPQEFSVQIMRERKKWEGVVKEAGIKPE